MGYNRPNIIIIVADALRPDHLSCYGYNQPTSPNLDKFAQESVLFKSAFSASPSTVSSIPSILTGLYPSFHGTGVDGNILTLNQEIPTLPQVLSREGYTTVGFNTNPYMASKHGYSKGYVSYFDLFPSQRKVCSRGTNEEVAKWLENARAQPFFAWIHYMDTHGPYFPRDPYFSQYSSDKPKHQITSFIKCFNQIWSRLQKDSNLITPEERGLLVNCYDSEISYFDQNFNNLLALLKDYSLLDNTAIIVTADHGEEFWEHHRWGHYMRMYDINLHVPLLIRYLPLASERKAISKQVRNIDIFPTVLDILNIKAGHYLSGLSLVPFISDEGSVPQAPVVSEGGGVHGISVKTYVDRVYSLRTPEWKYIKNVTQNKKQLFQLQNDPLELKNLVHEPYAQDVIRDLDLKLSNLLKLATEPKGNISPAKSDRQIIETLKALGYV